MLKDLEKRSNSEKPLVTQLSSKLGPVPSSCHYRKVLWGAVPLLLVAMGAVYFVKYGIPSSVENVPGQGVMVPEPELPSVSTALSPVTSPAHDNPASAVVEKIPTSLEMLRFEQQADQLQVELDFSSMPAYGLTRGQQGRQLILDLPGGVMAASLPNTAGLPLLRSVSSHGRNDGVQLVFSFNQGCRYDALVLAENPSGHGKTLRFVVQPEPVTSLPVALQPKSEEGAPQALSSDSAHVIKDLEPVAAEVPQPKQALVREEVQLSPRARAANYFRAAGTALQQGRQREAETALQTALVLDPGHIEARNLLLRLLVQYKRVADVKRLLVEGIHSVPQYLPYRVHYARLLIEDGALSEARDQLIHEPRPPVSEALDLYAMLATVYQRQAQYAEAAQTYRALLAVKPEQSVWWMGLGIALEGATLENQAQQAYRQAISCGGLSSGLQTYIRQRLTVLGSRDAHPPAGVTSGGKEPS